MTLQITFRKTTIASKPSTIIMIMTSTSTTLIIMTEKEKNQNKTEVQKENKPGKIQY